MFRQFRGKIASSSVIELIPGEARYHLQPYHNLTGMTKTKRFLVLYKKKCIIFNFTRFYKSEKNIRALAVFMNKGVDS